MTLQTKLSRLSDALVASVGSNVFHYWRPNMQAPFCVWAEDAEASALNAGNVKREQAVSGYVDYYTKTEYDTALDTIQTALSGLQQEFCFVWALDSVQYEEETNLIHYQWRWEMA